MLQAFCACILHLVAFHTADVVERGAFLIVTVYEAGGVCVWVSCVCGWVWVGVMRGCVGV